MDEFKKGDKVKFYIHGTVERRYANQVGAQLVEVATGDGTLMANIKVSVCKPVEDTKESEGICSKCRKVTEVCLCEIEELLKKGPVVDEPADGVNWKKAIRQHVQFHGGFYVGQVFGTKPPPTPQGVFIHATSHNPGWSYSLFVNGAKKPYGNDFNEALKAALALCEGDEL